MCELVILRVPTVRLDAVTIRCCIFIEDGALSSDLLTDFECGMMVQSIAPKNKATFLDDARYSIGKLIR